MAHNKEVITMKKFKCCICGKYINGYGNNPYPINKDENARCCDDCNINKVIPVRIINIERKKFDLE